MQRAAPVVESIPTQTPELAIDHTALFELMEATEKAHQYLETPGATYPSFGRGGWEIERQGVISQIIQSKYIVRELISKSKGLPIHFVDETGESIQGRVIASTDFVFGYWQVELREPEAKATKTLYKTAQQLREGYLMALSPTDNLPPEQVIDPEQLA